MAKRKRASLTLDKAVETLGAGGMLDRLGLDNKTETIEVEELPIGLLKANPYQPRATFDEGPLNELAESIRQQGFFGVLVARRKGRKYEIAYGERRLRASRLAELSTIPVHVRDLSDEEMMEMALTENVQREDLHPVEEARAYQQMRAELSLNIRDIAKRIGKSKSYVSSLLTILRYPDVEQAVLEHNIPVRTAEELAKFADDDERADMISLIVAGVYDRSDLIARRKGELVEEEEELGAPSVAEPSRPPKYMSNFRKTLKFLHKLDSDELSATDRPEVTVLLQDIVESANALLHKVNTPN